MNFSKKKFLSIIVMVVLLLVSLVATVNATDSQYFTIGNIEGNLEENQQITIDVKTKQSLTVDDVNLILKFDNSKLGTTESDVIIGNYFSGNDNAMIGVKTSEVVLGAYASQPFTINAGTTLFTVKFKAKKSVSLGSSDINLDVDMENSVTNQQYKEVASANVKYAITSIALDKQEGTLNLNNKEKVNLTATVSPANATDKTVKWTSSNTSVATVSNGLVTAVGNGNAVITAKAGDKTATYNVKVISPLKGISISKEEVTLLKGQETTLSLTYDPVATTDSKVATWSSSDESVVKVNNGKIEGLKEGEATITVKVGSFEKKCKVTVKVIPVGAIALDKKDIKLQVDGTENVKVLYNPENTTEKNVQWSSSNEEVAIVENGKIKGIKVGTAVITAKVGEKTTTVDVTVTEKVAEEVEKEENKPETEDKKDSNITENGKKEEPSVLPKTGDIAIGIVLLVMITSAGGAIYIIKNKNK